MENYIKTIDAKMDKQDHIISTRLGEQDVKIADAVDYMKTNIKETTRKLANEAIENGVLYLSMGYDQETESLNIVITGEV